MIEVQRLVAHHKAHTFFSVVIGVAISDHVTAFILVYSEEKLLNQQKTIFPLSIMHLQNVSVYKKNKTGINLFLNLNLVSVKKNKNSLNINSLSLNMERRTEIIPMQTKSGPTARKTI